MLIIWGRHTSSNVQKLLWGCSEMGVPFERPDMGGKFGYTDEYLAMNPNRLVPAIDDDGFILWESNACLRYLAAKHDSGGLWPEDLQVRANADRWMDWQLTTVWPVLRVAFHQLIRTPDDQRDMAAVDNAAKVGGEALKILDAWLAGRQFVCGDQFTMGDIPVGFVAYRWFTLDIERIELPNVEAWYKRLCERPGYREHIMIPLE
jgi:glutathione S-transferase